MERNNVATCSVGTNRSAVFAGDRDGSKLNGGVAELQTPSKTTTELVWT
ncbi:MAG: hypothetical protein IPH49_06695 [Ignavibacteria bacterium]|nr:hypothetical protein [Ignavibacteria bacterium]